MKTKLLLICGLLFVETFVATAQPSTATTSKVRVAVVDVVDKSAQPVQSGYKQTLLDEIEAHLVNSGIYKPISRIAVQAVMKELKFQHSGNVNDNQILRLGQMLGTEYIVLVTVGTMDNYMNVGLRLIDVESGELVNIVSDKMAIDSSTFNPKSLISKFFGNMKVANGKIIKLHPDSVQKSDSVREIHVRVVYHKRTRQYHYR